jgi:hypothetical protein
MAEDARQNPDAAGMMLKLAMDYDELAWRAEERRAENCHPTKLPSD